MAADSVKSIPAARRIGMTWMILCLVVQLVLVYWYCLLPATP
jgi:Na+/proline symporter